MPPLHGIHICEGLRRTSDKLWGHIPASPALCPYSPLLEFRKVLTPPVLDRGLCWTLPLEHSSYAHLLALALLIPGSSTHGVTLEEGQAEVWMSPVRLIMNDESFSVTGMQFSPFGRM